MKARVSGSHWRNTVSATVVAFALGTAANAAAQTADPAPAPADAQEAPADEQTGDEIVVTGFRQSLEAALNVKRASVSAVDAIVAEDIAKFPDQNLAELLQRIPGISIQRDGGEGRAITVRGLGAQFTRVRVNGLETITTTADGASANRERAFDFNVFASELFSSLVVHKTAEASLDEGSLGAVVDLNTGNPLGGKYGFHLRRIGAGQLQRPLEELGAPRRRPALVEVARRDDRRLDLRRMAEDRHARARQQHGALGAGPVRQRRRDQLLDHRELRRNLRSERGVQSGRALLPSAHPALRRGPSRSRAAGLDRQRPMGAERCHQDLDRRPLFALQGDPRREMGRSAASLQRAFDQRRQPGL